MRRYVFFIIFLVLVVLLGLKLHRDPAYVLIATQKLAVEIPLWLAAGAVLISFVFLYYLIRLVKFAGSLSDRWRIWSVERRNNKALKSTHRGLITLAEGNWQKAEKLLLKGVNNSSKPLLNYLALALAAQGQKAYQRRSDYLYEAHNAEPDAEMAIGLMQAQLQINHHQYEQALATVTRLHELDPKQQQVLRLLKHLYIKLGQWSEAEKLLIPLKKYGGYPEGKYQAIELQIYQHLFADLSELKQVEKLWQALAEKIQQNPEIYQAYLKRLIAFKAFDVAEQTIRALQKKQWSGILAAYYGEIDFDLKKQWQTAQDWLTKHPQDAELFCTLGQLAERQQELSQAYDYYQASLILRPAAKTYLLLGKLCQKMQRSEEASACFQKGLSLSVDSPY